jgi:hypothetical protein
LRSYFIGYIRFESSKVCGVYQVPGSSELVKWQHVGIGSNQPGSVWLVPITEPSSFFGAKAPVLLMV